MTGAPCPPSRRPGRGGGTPPPFSPPPPAHPAYRADIDGLRAVAVLAVAGFHAFPETMAGGFIGVDLFFVISGFLISSILFAGLARGSFRFRDFYGRRIRRIFPALLVVLSACLAWGWLALFADEYRQLGRHVAWSAGFASNIALWMESGYFDQEAVTKPLLHLWSLGIEEQFYIVWPLLSWLAWKQRHALLPMALFLALCSFALNAIVYRNDPIADFYAPHTRFWELLAGSLLAHVTMHGAPWLPAVGPGRVWHSLGERKNDLLASLGLLLLVIGFLTITRQRLFPGYWAMLPVLGAVLIIAAGAHAWLNRVALSHPVAVWFGLISYPLYLWHWPLLSFAWILEGGAPSPAMRGAAVLIAIPLAWATYRWIERPIRFGPPGPWKTATLSLAMMAMGGLGLGAFLLEGLPSREQKMAAVAGDVGHVAFFRHQQDVFHPCTPRRLAEEAPVWEGHVRCAQSKDHQKVEIALIGDSHAEHLFMGLAERLPDKNIAYYIKGASPFLDKERFTAIYDHVLASPTIRKVVFSVFAHQVDMARDGEALEHELLDIAGRLLRGGKEVYITDDVPDFPFGPRKCRARKLFAPDRICTIDKKQVTDGLSSFLAMLGRVTRRENRIRHIETWKYFCDDSHCGMEKDGKLLYRDKDHLNINGSRYLGERIIHDHPAL